VVISRVDPSGHSAATAPGRLRSGERGWFKFPDIGPDPGPLIPDFNGAFDDFASPPGPASVKLPFDPDFATRIGMDFGVAGPTAWSPDRRSIGAAFGPSTSKTRLTGLQVPGGLPSGKSR